MNKVKRIAAIIGIILIVSMYFISFISAIFASEKAAGLFAASLFCTVVIPIMIWFFIIVYQRVHKNEGDDTQSSDPNQK